MNRLIAIIVCTGAFLSWAGNAAAEIVETDGYKYVQLSLTDLWVGFFAFLLGIVFVLVGLFLFFIWRKSLRDQAEGAPRADTGTEDDGTVF